MVEMQSDAAKRHVSFEKIVRAILPSVMATLLDRDLIDAQKSRDPNYLWSVYYENDEIVAELRGLTLIHDSFLEVAEYAVAHGKPEVAVVLIATAVEHVLNWYYALLLSNKGLSNTEIREVVRNNSIAAKRGWLFSLTSRERLPEELGKRIDMLVELRNALVHYKPLPVGIDELESDTWVRIKSRLTSLDYDELLNLPIALERALETSLCDQNPLLQTAHELCDIMMSREY